VIGRRKLASDILSRTGFRQVSIDVEGIKGRGLKRGMMTILRLPYGFYQSLSLIRGFSPHLVLGVGGYSSGPVCLAAKILGIPTAIHEQNSFPGLTNRLLSRAVDRVFVSFEESAAYLHGGAIQVTGNPIREELLEGEKERDRDAGPFTVLVTGGSQGAGAVNRVFVAALEILKGKGKEIAVIHQTGESDYARVSEEYRRHGLQGEVTPFIQDMSGTYRRADIVVCRAGASTVSELAAMGKPSILIPYPYAANSHQETNARILARAGGRKWRSKGILAARPWRTCSRNTWKTGKP